MSDIIEAAAPNTMTVMRRYTWKLYPNPEQLEILHQQRMMCADMWNALLQRREDVWRRERKPLSWEDLSREITVLYGECPEWRALSTHTARRINKSLEQAFEKFFNRAKQGAGAQSGYPRYRRRKDYQHIPHDCDSGCKITHLEGKTWSLYLKGVPGLIHARGELPADVLRWTIADVIFRDNVWWFSVAVEMLPRRPGPGNEPKTIRLAPIGALAEINGELDTPDHLLRAADLDEDASRMASRDDERWKSVKAKAKRVRSDALHVWSKRLVDRSSALTIILPSIRENTVSPRGDDQAWGANVTTVSAINRSVLSFAPAMAAQMLKYKAKEAGIRCDVLSDAAPEIAIGEKLVAAGKAVRKSKRAIRRRQQ